MRMEEDPLDLIAMRLVREGFGSWAEIMATPVDQVLRLWHYLRFQDELAAAAVELNREDAP